MTIIRTMEALGEGILGFLFKIFLIMIGIIIILSALIILVVYWPFTISLIVGLLVCEFFYRQISTLLNIDFPEYFYINIQDLLTTFHHGEEEIEAVRTDMQDKREKAKEELETMDEALKSAQDQLDQITTKRKFKTLFTKQPQNVSPRLAKALEMEIGKPRWARYIDKAQEKNGDWSKYYI